tara:strand:- start:2512 stop:2799 length:288 start_codon:yes stop_codon:yes gene_type:complete
MYFINENGITNDLGEILDLREYPSDEFESFLVQKIGYLPDLGHNNILNLTLFLLSFSKEDKPESEMDVDQTSKIISDEDWDDVDSLASIISFDTC